MKIFIIICLAVFFITGFVSLMAVLGTRKVVDSIVDDAEDDAKKGGL